MSDRTFEKADSKSRSSKSTGKDLPPQSQVENYHPLRSAINRFGNTGSISNDAAILQRAPFLAQHSLLQLQQQYGNHYVQRVVQLAKQGNGQTEVSPEVKTAIERQRGNGHGLDNKVQRQMESAFDTDFSGVRIHTGTEADSLNQALQAPTFANGQDIVKQASTTLLNYQPDETTISRWQSQSEATKMSDQVIDSWSSALGLSLPSINIHHDPMANQVAMAYDAEAVTVENNIYLSQEAQTPGLIAHEIAHVAQSRQQGSYASNSEREKEAERVRKSALLGQHSVKVQLSAPPSEPMGHPAARILLRTGRWLLTRTTRSISKHIARHGRRIGGRAVHSIFRNPRQIRNLVSRTAREATEIARNATVHGAEDVIEQGGVRIFQQATRTPGKYRLIVEKQFSREIGTQGERILRIVIDMSGRIVTAFPTDRFLAIGLGIGALNVFSESTAEASEKIRSRIEAEENRPVDWVGEIIDFLNPLSGGTLNEGEDLMLDIDRIIRQTTFDVIQEIEETEQMSLGQEQRNAIRDLVAAAIGTGMEMEELEEE